MNDQRPALTHEWNIDILKERQLAIVLKDFVTRYEGSEKPQPDTPIHETTLYCAAKAYLNETRR